MVELIEYLLVFGVTAAIAGFSLLVFSGFLPVIHQAAGQSEVDQIAGAAVAASQDGNASVVLTLTNATVSCSDGSVDLSTGGNTYYSSIGAACDFAASNLDGLYVFSFTRSPSGVALEVTTA